jgi:exopolysaccharide production protein ExoZ
MPPHRRPRIECISLLRCLAATLVVLYHTDLHILRLSDGRHIHAFGFAAAGTDLLFVISGFVMVYITRGNGVGFGDFMFRRAARIAPLYWLLTVVMLAAFLVAPALFHTTAFELPHVLASLSFLPYPHPVLGIQRPFLFPGWALNYFMFFYVLFGLFLFLPAKRRIVAVGLILISLSGLWLLFPGRSTLLDFYGAPIIIDFVVGMAVAWIYQERDAVGPAIIALVLAASAALFAIGVAREISGGDERFLYWGLTDGGLLFSFVFIEKEWGWWTPAVLRQLGQASFAIYLSNQFTLAIATKALQATGLGPVLGLAGSQLLLVVSALAAGLLVNVVAERPMQAFALRAGGRLRQGAMLRSGATAH